MANYIDLKCQKFGKLTVVNDAGRYKTGSVKWLCQCECGETRITKGSYLRSGGITACKKCSAYTDYSGKKVGKLHVIERSEDVIVGKLKQKRIKWKCRCDCGCVVYRDSCKLKRGNCCCKNCKSQIDKKNNSTGYKQLSGTYWSLIQRQAKLRGLLFEIDIKYAWNLFEKQNGQCILSGMNIEFAENKKAYLAGETTASLDRIDSSKGYVKGNIQWVHKWINRMKSNHAQKTFIDLCKKVAGYNEN